MAKHIYTAANTPGLNFTVVLINAKDKEVRQQVRFVNGQFQTDDDKLAEAIDDLIATKQAIAIRCKKADRAAAEALARAHAAKMATTGAHKGGVSTDAMKKSMNTELLQRDAQLRNEGVDKVQVAADESLILSEKGVTAPSPELGAGDAESSGEPAAKPAAQPILQPTLKIG